MARASRSLVQVEVWSTVIDNQKMKCTGSFMTVLQREVSFRQKSVFNHL